MLDFRPVLQIVGLILCVLAAAMLVPALAGALAGGGGWRAFCVSSGLTLFCGLALVLGMRVPLRGLGLRQAYLATALGWIAPCLFAALPFALALPQMSVTDALFEATSGVTATASTALSGLSDLPPGVLVWRALLQWLGGAGALVTAVAVLPGLGVGGMQFFRLESLSAKEAAGPRAIRLGLRLGAVYGGLTLALGGALWLAGLSGFDAWLHAMATLSSGGFSSWDASLGHYHSVAVDAIVFLGMVAAGMPFLVLMQLVRGNVKALLNSVQAGWYLALIAVCSASVAGWLVLAEGWGAADAIHQGAFSVASVMTGTGFASADYGTWTGMPAALLLFLALLGGCAGSTTGGIKIFRLQMLVADALVQMRRLLRPHAVLMAGFRRRTIPEDVRESVMGYLFVYAVSFSLLALGLSLTGLDFIGAMSGAACALANLGHGLGPVVGPSGNIAALPDVAKWLLCIGMVFGRMEIFPLLVLLIPGFWRQ